MKSHYWIKLYHEILDDAKMGRLPDRLWRRAIELFLMAGEEHNEGHLPCVADMAWRLRLDDEALLEDLRALEQVNILTQLKDGVWLVTKFAERQAPMSSAERQQRYRDRQRKEQYYGNDSSDRPVTKCNADVDTDVDTDVNTDVEVEVNAYRRYEQAAGILSPLVADQLGDLVDDYSDDWVCAAIEETGKAGARISINYLAAILDRWIREGFRAPFKGNGGNKTTQEKSMEAIEQWGD